MRSYDYETVASEDGLDNHSNLDEVSPTAKRRSCLTASWHGPGKPQSPHVTLWLENVQTWPYRVTKNQNKWIKYGFTLFPVLVWVAVYSILVPRSLMAEPTVDGRTAEFVRCTTQMPFWHGNNAKCGINGIDCLRGYPIGTEFRFKCPANCKRESWTYKPISAGTKVAYHESFIVGSENSYRADSFICAAALHRGIISDSHGGCGVARLGEAKSNFKGTHGNNSMDSIAFDTEFPASFSFDDLDGLEMRGCGDKRSALMLVSAVSIFAVGYLSVHAHLFVLAVTVIGFCTVILASNPPWNGGTAHDNAEIISLGARRLLPMLLAMVPIYKFSLQGALLGLEANLSRAIFWCTPFYLGIVENYTFGMIPIDRLTISDLNGQAGAWTALFIIVIIVMAIVLSQAYIIWRAGKLIPFLTGYITTILALALLATIPSQTLRIHHYILALVFLPGTGFQTTPSLVYNGLLTALFIAGVSRWDFDSILQTYDQLRRGGPRMETGAAAFIEPLIDATSFILKWKSFNDNTKWSGFSLLINDVERYRGNGTEFNITEWALSQKVQPAIGYIRIALADVFSKKTGPFTMAAVANITGGTWSAPASGMT